MELWLLGAGAIVLIAITLWIVWPSQTTDAVDTTVQGEEVSRTQMAENIKDQYPNATADQSASGVATALDPSEYSYPPPTSTETRSVAQPRTMGLGAAALLSIGGAVGGAWLYARWQRERNKPINRLRRGARDVASRVGERLPDVDDMPHGAAPMSGAATALLLTGLLASRALRRDSADPTEEVRGQASDMVREVLGRGREATEHGRKESRRLSSRLPKSRLQMDRLAAQVEPKKPALMGIGLGGLAILVGGTYLVWRILRRGTPNTA
jgi:hypothetical protein